MSASKPDQMCRPCLRGAHDACAGWTLNARGQEAECVCICGGKAAA